MSVLLIPAWLVPLLAAMPLLHRRLPWLPWVAAAPALAAAVLVPTGEQLQLDWLLIGSVFGLDEIGRVFLMFTAILWLAAGVYTAATMRGGAHGERFNTLFLLAMAGNFWLITSQDLIGFYVGFAIMGIASYGLVVHVGDRRALRAGRVYLVLTLMAEVALFAAFVLIAGHAGSIRPTPAELAGLDDLTIALLVLGLAVKAGLVPLHVWLPLAHPAAPIPASAVLSGTMIKVAILGWLRFLPVGEVALPEWGLLFLFVGQATAFFAVPIGLVQSDPKVLLAYSSISKMGLMAMVLGVALIEVDVAPLAAAGLALYAGHHALTKGGLFLGVGLRKSAPGAPLVLTGVTLLAVSLAAVPLTSGAVAKYGIKPVFAGIEWSWFGVPIALTTLATAWLMARFLWIIWHLRPAPQAGLVGVTLAWIVLPFLVLLYPLFLGSPGAWATDIWLIALAVLLALPVALLAQYKPSATAPVVDSVKAGDLLVLARPVLLALRWGAHRLRQLLRRLSKRGWASILALWQAAAARSTADVEARLRAWPVSGGLWLLILLAMIGLGLISSPDLPVQPRVDRPEPASGVASAQRPAPLPSARREEGAALPGEMPASLAATDPPSSEDSQRDTAGTERDPSEPGAQSSDAGDQVERQAGAESPAGAPVQPGPMPTATEGTKAPSEPRGSALSEPMTQPEDGTEAPSASAICAADQSPVFRYPPSGESITLTRCAPVAGELVPLEAPPLSNRLVRLLQLALNDLGFDSGPVDGLMGPRTRTAIRRFQEDQGLAVDGAITFELLERLQRGLGETSR